MFQGIFSAASGMMAQGMLGDIVADNLANVGTVGFKKTAMAFKGFSNKLMHALHRDDDKEIGSYNAMVVPNGSQVQFEQGAIAETGNPLNVALQGDGFFSVTQPNGETAYTRDGRFRKNDQNTLVTLDGNEVEGQNGSIQIPRNASEIIINNSGGVSVKVPGQSNLQQVGQLKITQFEDNDALTRQGQTLYSKGDAIEKETKGVTILQGALEQSNVNAVRELVSSITGTRTYEGLQRSINMQNHTLEKAVNDVGRYV